MKYEKDMRNSISIVKDYASNIKRLCAEQLKDDFTQNEEVDVETASRRFTALGILEANAENILFQCECIEAQLLTCMAYDKIAFKQ